MLGGDSKNKSSLVCAPILVEVTLFRTGGEGRVIFQLQECYRLRFKWEVFAVTSDHPVGGYDPM